LGLAALGSEAASLHVGAILPLVGDEECSRAVQKAATEAIAVIRSLAAAKASASCLEQKDPKVRASSCQCLAALGSEAMKPYANVLSALVTATVRSAPLLAKHLRSLRH